MLSITFLRSVFSVALIACSLTVSAAPALGTGIVITPIGMLDDYAKSVVVQPNGKIVVVGYAYNQRDNGHDYDFALARYTAEGLLDPTFNGSGKIMNPIGSYTAVGQSVALQADGKIIVTGYTGISSNYDFAIARYTDTGAIDASFGVNGKVITPIGSSYAGYANSVTIQTDGKIIVAGYCLGVSNFDFALARYTANGVLDTSFGDNGVVITSMGALEDKGNSVVLQPDGKIIVTGYSYNNATYQKRNYFALARYTTAGVLDSSFGDNGKVLTPIGLFNAEASSAVLQPDGKIVVAGYSSNGNYNDFALARYTVNGAFDTTFNDVGYVTTAIGTSNSGANALLLQPDGKIILAGYGHNGSNYDFALTRFTATGALDTSFNGNGKVLTSSGSRNDYATGVVLQSSGKVIVTGYSCIGNLNSVGSYCDFALARYTPDGVVDQTFGSRKKLSPGLFMLLLD